MVGGGAIINTPLYLNLNMAEGELNNNKKDTSKRQKMDGKSNDFGMHISLSIFGII